MSTSVQFTPSTTAPFSFQATIAGSQYNVTVPWNTFGERWYCNVSDLSNNLIVSTGLCATGPTLPASFTWANQVTTAASNSPHNVPIGTVANVYVSKTGTAFDGNAQVLAVTPTTFTYSLTTNPQQQTPVSGSVNFALNLVGPYISGGYLLFHWETQTFEFG